MWGRDSIGLGSGTKVKKYAGLEPELDSIVRRALPRTPWKAPEQRDEAGMDELEGSESGLIEGLPFFCF